MQKGFSVVNLHGTASGVIAVPVIGDNGHWWVGNDDTGVKAQGEDGTTPHVGENGNWFVGDVDTGVQAQGPKGEPGPGTEALEKEINEITSSLGGYKFVFDRKTTGNDTLIKVGDVTVATLAQNFNSRNYVKAGTDVLTFDSTGTAILNHNCGFSNTNYVLFVMGYSEMFICTSSNPISGNASYITGRLWNDATQPVTGTRYIQWMAFEL